MSTKYVVTWCRLARNGSLTSGSSKHNTLASATTKSRRMAFRGALVTVEKGDSNE
jgi:hypothetical protein